MTTIDWLTYPDLFAVLTAHGFISKPLPEGGQIFRHPTGAVLAFAEMEPDQRVVNYHYGAARAAMDDYGIMTRDAFELALLQAAHRLPTTA
ncbi:MAG: hypothetical protein H8F28_25470 [Fibrella sp.]|nr:hypothetical protein [Armatimonadota bacterium]